MWRQVKTKCQWEMLLTDSCLNPGDRKRTKSREFGSFSNSNMLFLLAPTRTPMAAAGLVRSASSMLGWRIQVCAPPHPKHPQCQKTMASYLDKGDHADVSGRASLGAWVNPQLCLSTYTESISGNNKRRGRVWKGGTQSVCGFTSVTIKKRDSQGGEDCRAKLLAINHVECIRSTIGGGLGVIQCRSFRVKEHIIAFWMRMCVFRAI